MLPRARLALSILVVIGVALSATALVPEDGSGAPLSRAAPLITDEVALPAAERTTPLPASARVTVELGLAYPNSGALIRFLSAIEDPASPLYRQFLSHAEFEEAFAPTPATIGAVESELRAAGAGQITAAPDRLSVSATFSVAALESFLGVSIVQFSDHGASFYTAVGSPELPTALQGVVSGITGLSDVSSAGFSLDLAHEPLTPVIGPTAAAQFVIDNESGNQFFLGSDYANALRATDLFPGTPGAISNATFPTDVAIATLLASGYNATLGAVRPPYDPTVIAQYFNDTLAPSWPHSTVTGVPVTVDGQTPPLPGSFGDVNDSSLDSFENSLDLEMAGSLAPGAALYNFYFSGSLLAGGVTNGEVASFFDADLAAALSYNYSPARLGVVSGSFGLGDLNDSTWDNELAEAAAMGVTVVMASGDSGNAPNSLTGRDDGQWPVWPATAASNTSGALSVGGVTLGLGGEANGWANRTAIELGYDANSTGITSASVWWDTTGGSGNYAGSEGGVSTQYAEPEWEFRSAAQPNIVNASVLQGVSALGRTGPDIALPANATIAYVVNISGQIYASVLEGTSIAAPSCAGLLADEIAVGHHEFGFIDPEIYRIESYFAAHPGPTNAFYDITNGSNYVFGAEPGWDAATGWGMPIGPLLYAADANPAIRDYVYTGPTPGLPPSPTPPAVPWTEVLVIIGVSVTVAVILVIVMARPSHRTAPPPPPYGATLAPPAPTGTPISAFPSAPSTVATFACPYCGAIRPAEPGRCPKCGAY